MLKNRFKKILVPLDGSANSIRGLNEAISLARQCNSKIFGVHVISRGPFFIGEKIQELRNFQIKTGMKILENAKTSAAKNGIDFNGKILRDNEVRNAISDYAKQRKCDIIIMGAKGTAYVRGSFLGSIAYGVVNISEIPVLVVK